MLIFSKPVIDGNIIEGGGYLCSLYLSGSGDCLNLNTFVHGLAKIITVLSFLVSIPVQETSPIIQVSLATHVHI